MERLRTVYFLGSLINNIKGIFNKVNEIVDYLNTYSSNIEGNYKSYVAIVTQTDLTDPVATVVYNDFNSTPTWTRDGVGSYYATLTGEFTADKTVTFTTLSYLSASTPSFVTCKRDSDDECFFLTFDTAANAADNVLKEAVVEIRVYN